jgi:DNA-binding NtrC family response regulator
MDETPILLISADCEVVSSVESAFATLAGLKVAKSASWAGVESVLQQVHPTVVLCHVAANEDAHATAALVRHLAALRHDVPTLALCEPDFARDGLDLLRLGAADCFLRPLDLSRLTYLVDVLTLRRRVPSCRAAGVEAIHTDDAYGFIYRPDGPLGRLMGQVRRVASLETNVLIQGETGTGKTHLARIIHQLSSRRERPFLTVNCGALSANLIESELFGHVRGAFTGADQDRAGKLVAAGAGTLFLDDIDALPLELQARLLRVIEERVFEAVGSNKPQPLKARVIAASNRSLQDDAQAGKFRSDLYYRLSVMVFYLPPFRENRALVPALARHFVQEYASRHNLPARGLTSQALQALEAYDWPGNVRELRNVIERAVVLCPGARIDVADLSDHVKTVSPAPAPKADPALLVPSTSAVTLAARKQETEEQVIREVLSRNNYNKLRTAAALGISRMTLYNKLRLYGLMGP